MNIKKHLQPYVISVVVFLALDAIWLGVVARDLYQTSLGHLLAPEVNWTAAALFYLLFLAGLQFFATGPGVEARSWKRALGRGAFYGLLTYATYDLTNLSTLKDWPLAVTLLDMLWGTVLGGLTAGVTGGLMLRRRV